MQFDRLWRGARLATLSPQRPGLGQIDHGAIGESNGRITFVGLERDLPSRIKGSEELWLDGRLVTPGLIDCHTHLVFAGDRSREFEQRLTGTSYQQLAQANGGILATVTATRAATEAQLTATATERLHCLLAEGVTTIEIKSGYGLDVETEMRMLRVARSLGKENRVDVVTTLLAAHALPPDLDREQYLNLIVHELIPGAANNLLADAVDAFCESIAFTPAEVRRVFAAARLHGIPVKLHADQLSDLGGASLAAEHQALSADHLEWTTRDGVEALAHSGTVAVLLPGAFFALREKQVPPVQHLRDAGVRIAVATDCNPGSSPLLSLLTAMNMAAVQFGLTVEEVVAGVTREAAQALGRESQTGTLDVGKQCDLAIWNVERPAELVYWLGRNPLHARVWRGQ